jgi:hypothetical protein
MKLIDAGIVDRMDSQPGATGQARYDPDQLNELLKSLSSRALSDSAGVDLAGADRFLPLKRINRRFFHCRQWLSTVFKAAAAGEVPVMRGPVGKGLGSLLFDVIAVGRIVAESRKISEGEWFSPVEAARAFHTSPQQLKELIAAGVLAATVVPRGRTRKTTRIHVNAWTNFHAAYISGAELASRLQCRPGALRRRLQQLGITPAASPSSETRSSCRYWYRRRDLPEQGELRRLVVGRDYLKRAQAWRRLEVSGRHAFS